MTDEKIITALKICSSKGKCKDCPYEDYCETGGDLDVLVLDLINRYADEIERLKKDYEIYEEASGLKWAKTEGIKKFAERLRSHYDQYDDYDDVYVSHIRDDIDFLVEEMTEERK